MRRGVSSLTERVREAGYRLTPQRVAIIEALSSLHTHPSAEEVFQAVRHRIPTVSLATVYKTLDLLKRMGLVQEVCLPDHPTRYEMSSTPHPNLVCLHCGTVEDLDSLLDASSLLQRLGLSPPWEVVGYRLDLLALCPRCRARGAVPTPSLPRRRGR